MPDTAPCPHPDCNGTVKCFESKKKPGTYFWICDTCDRAGRKKFYDDENGSPKPPDVKEHSVRDNSSWQDSSFDSELTISELLPDIAARVAFKPVRYRVEADVLSAYEINGLCLYTLCDGVVSPGTITVTAPRSSESAETLIDRRVIATGDLKIYGAKAEFQLSCGPSDLKDIGESSFITTRKKWREEVADFLVPVRKFPANPEPERLALAVIGPGSETKGVNDFMYKIKRLKNVSYETFFPEKGETFSNCVIRVLKNLNSDFDYACIVRGGGDRRQILKFSEPSFVRAIAESHVPCILGLGHVSDIELCSEAAEAHGGKDGNTPTGAAGIVYNLAFARKNAINKEMANANAAVAKKSASRYRAAAWFFALALAAETVYLLKTMGVW